MFVIVPDTLCPNKPATLFPDAFTVPAENTFSKIPVLYPTKPPTAFTPVTLLDEYDFLIVPVLCPTNPPTFDSVEFTEPCV